MAALYEAEVLRKADEEVLLRVYIVHPDEREFHEKGNFALQLLWDATLEVKGETPLGKAIPEENIKRPSWVVVLYRKYIQSVEIVSTRNHPIPDDYEISDHYETRKGLPQAEIRIQVTDSRWIAHLHDGMKWESAALDMDGHV